MPDPLLIDVDDSVLVVVDVQKTFLHKLPEAESAILLERICWLIRVARWAGVPQVVMAEDLAGNGGVHPSVVGALAPGTRVHDKMHFGLAAEGRILQAVSGSNRNTASFVCVAARSSSFPLIQAGSKVKKWSITIPALRSAKSIKVINERCMPSIANHSQGRSLRKIASGAKATSRASALQVAIAISGCGSASTVSRKNVGRASGLLSTCASALPSSHEGLASFIKPLYE